MQKCALRCNCGVAYLLSCLILYIQNYSTLCFKNLSDFSSLAEEYSTEISGYEVGLVSFEKVK